MPHEWKSDWRAGPERDEKSDWHPRHDHDKEDEEEICGNNDLSDCPHCGETIYEHSEQCPHCGTYLDASEEHDPSTSKRPSLFIIVGVLLCLAVFAIWIFCQQWW